LTIDRKGERVYVVRFDREVVTSPALLIPLRITGWYLLKSCETFIGAA
jgi:hypothetical protein